MSDAARRRLLGPAADPAPDDRTPRSEKNAGPTETRTVQSDHVPRFVVAATEAPLEEPAREPFHSSKALLVFDDEGGLGNSLCARLDERGQRWVRVRRHPGVARLEDGLWGVDLADGGQIHELVQSIRAEHGPLAGVVFVSPVEAATAAEIELEFPFSVGIEEALLNVNNALSQVPGYPENVDQPSIKAEAFSSNSFMYFRLTPVSGDFTEAEILQLRDWAEENDLHLGPETNMPRWDGTSPDYELAVSVLLEAG